MLTLVAFYPKRSLALADERLRRQSCAVKDFADECVQSGLARFVDLSVADSINFKNYNSPDDLPGTT